jgi:heme exporter protein A
MDFQSVRLTDVSRHYGRRRALSRVTLQLDAGEVVGLLGPNGAGKSTLIGILSTLVSASAGHVRYGEVTAADGGHRLRARIGLLAHELQLYGELTARQNLAFAAALHGLDPDDVVEPALERAALLDRADEVVNGFSRGMRQRLALERSLLHHPRLVLLDEPFTGLDDRSVLAVSARLRDIAATGGIVLVATHDLDLADGLITRMAVMHEGRLLSDEPAPAGLRSRYREVVGGL